MSRASFAALKESGDAAIINISATLHYGATWYQVRCFCFVLFGSRIYVSLVGFRFRFGFPFGRVEVIQVLCWLGRAARPSADSRGFRTLFSARVHVHALVSIGTVQKCTSV